METLHCNAENEQMIEVEIYETGEKTRITAQNQKIDKKDFSESSIIMTAAEYARFKANLSNHSM